MAAISMLIFESHNSYLWMSRMEGHLSIKEKRTAVLR